ncbi:hypothetical protein [Parasediminibacterium sp. JCM 36343]|uniref:hypothetical protein n=1 Tax=Parasediminibacterium sp. JCM 36343 TaxID=3374279 RepID=UPI00397C119C
MKLLLEIKDEKADFIMELLRNFSFVKAETISQEKKEFLRELKGAVEEVKLAKLGKIKLKPIEQLIDEL